MPLYVFVGKHFPDGRGEHFPTCGALEKAGDALAADQVVRHKFVQHWQLPAPHCGARASKSQVGPNMFPLF